MSYECHIIVDFEFNPTAKEYRKYLRNEIIEIGAVKLNDRFEEIGRFSCYVRPEMNWTVTPEISRLTGIRDRDVREAADFETALSLFSSWAGPAKCRIYSWSLSDFRQLDDECWVKGVDFPENFHRWMDLQKVWQRIIGYPHNLCMSLKDAAAGAGIPIDPEKAHRAVYDSEITAEILRATRNKEYMQSVAEAKRRVRLAVRPAGTSLGGMCGKELSELLSRLQSA